MSRIRPATIHDIEQLTRMGRDFHAQTCVAMQSDFDDESFQNTVCDLLASDNAALMVLESEDLKPIGMACAVLMPLYFNVHHKVAQEMFCWVDPEHRGGGMALFSALENWGILCGAKTMIIASVSGLRDDVLDRKYRAKGFMPTDNFYTKVLAPCQVQ